MHRVKSEKSVDPSNSGQPFVSSQRIESPVALEGQAFIKGNRGRAYRDPRLSIPRVAGILSAAVSLLLLLAYSTPHWFPNSTEEPHYAVYIDAGSSGTRVHVFQYQHAPWPAYLQLQLPEPTLAVEPGLSSYASFPTQAGSSLAPLLKFAHSQIPEELWSVTPIRLLATAGLRLLTEDQSSSILASCIDVVAASHFLYHYSHVAVLEGDLEGLYGWAAANFVTGALQAASEHQHSGRREAVSVQGFQGIMEMGGASMQITFLPLLPLDLPHQSSASLRLPGIPSKLFTHSYLGMGMDSALSRAATVVLQQQPNSEIVHDPCLPIGYISEDGRHGTATFSGCLNIARQIVPALNCSSHHAHAHLGSLFHSKRCTLEGSFVPKLDGPFIAMENFFWTAKALNLHTGATLRHLATAAEVHCSKHWSSLHAEFSGHIPDQYLVRYCFGAVYVYTLLHEVFQLGLDEQRLAFTNSVQGLSGSPITLSWVLGAMVVEGMAEGKKIADRALLSVITRLLFPGHGLEPEDRRLPFSGSSERQERDQEAEIEPYFRLHVVLLFLVLCSGAVCLWFMVAWLWKQQGRGREDSFGGVERGEWQAGTVSVIKASGNSLLRIPSVNSVLLSRMEDQTDTASWTALLCRKVTQE